MKMLTAIAFTGLLAAMPVVGATTDAGSESGQNRRGDAGAAATAHKQGRMLSLAEIEKKIVPSMRGAQYIGFVFDSDSAVYTLKFLRDGNVIWILVDGRSGAVLGRAGG
ncbi:hypothetical protein [Sphingomonas sp. RS2018]